MKVNEFFGSKEPRRTFVDRFPADKVAVLFQVRAKYQRDGGVMSHIYDKVREWSGLDIARRTFQDFLKDDGTIYKEPSRGKKKTKRG